MGITHHAHGVRERAGDRQPGAAARHGRPAGRRADADSRALERAGDRLGGRDAEAEGRGVRAAAERTSACSCRPRRGCDTMACMEAAASGRAEVRLLPGRQSVWLESRRDLCPRSAIGEARPDRLSEHDAQHRPRPRPGAGDDHPAGAGPRRRAAADDAGIDVQLRAAERRRPAAARRAAERGGGDCSDRGGGAGRRVESREPRVKSQKPSIGRQCDQRR